MVQLPNDLNETVIQAQAAAQAALDAGHSRVQVEIKIPELKIQPVAQQFIQPFIALGPQLRLLFPDAGSAALARRDWGNPPYGIRGLLETKVQAEETFFIFIEPSSVEVEDVERICDAISPRPMILLNPCLENVSVVGIGYASRRLRDRFLSTIEPCYHLQPLDQAILFRCYPHPWQVWQEEDGIYQQRAEFPTKPSSEDIEELLYGGAVQEGTGSTAQKPGLLVGLQRFIKALSQ